MSSLLVEISVWVVFINLFAFVLCWLDKTNAKSGKRRVSEKNLLLSVAVGGTIGFVIAMLIFKHKTSKPSFLTKLFFVITLQIVAIVYFFCEGKPITLENVITPNYKKNLESYV